MAHEDEVFKNFLIEMAERLAEFEQGLSELEQTYSVNAINLLFRAIHSTNVHASITKEENHVAKQSLFFCRY